MFSKLHLAMLANAWSSLVINHNYQLEYVKTKLEASESSQRVGLKMLEQMNLKFHLSAMVRAVQNLRLNLVTARNNAVR